MRILIIDDDPFVTTSLTTILSAEEDIQAIGTGHDGAEAIKLYARHRPDILLIDIQMGEVSGIDAARQILDDDPCSRIVFLTTFADDEYIVAALCMGARGYLIKQEVATIAPALRLVMAGQSVLGGEVLDRMDTLIGGRAGTGQPGPGQAGEEPGQAGREQKGEGHASPSQERCRESGVRSGEGLSTRLAGLSERENEIVGLVAKGLDNKEIAGALYISEGTVRNHISTILAKLGLKNRTQLAIRYYRPEG